jgi:hypothetical protein
MVFLLALVSSWNYARSNTPRLVTNNLRTFHSSQEEWELSAKALCTVTGARRASGKFDRGSLEDLRAW